MKFVRYQDGSRAAWGIVEGDSVTPVLGDPFTGWVKDQSNARAVGLARPAARNTVENYLCRLEL